MKTKEKITKYMVYTDGACEPNPGTGGYCSLIFRDGDMTPSVIITGGAKNTTNNRMEIMGVLCSFNYIKEKSSITFYSDSQYVCNSINKWLYGWKAKNKVMKNMDLWNTIWDYKQKHTIKAVWVKGHSGNFFNEIADGKSIEVIARLRKGRKKSFEEIKIIAK
jgi:ribonuclease HI